MKRSVQVVGRPEVTAGFALTGLTPLDAATPAEGADRMRELLDRPDAGVVLVDQALYDGFPDDLRRRLGRRPLPMVVPFPGPTWVARREGPEAYIVELLRQVIGYRVRLK
jgi:vacuolar-type H+-ATPase subunit F/Vma7